MPGFGVLGQCGDHGTDHGSGGAYSLVVSRLLREPGEEIAEVGAGITDPA